MTKDRVSSRKFWLAITVLGVLFIAALLVLSTGALATWLDPDPEGAPAKVPEALSATPTGALLVRT